VGPGTSPDPRRRVAGEVLTPSVSDVADGRRSPGSPRPPPPHDDRTEQRQGYRGFPTRAAYFTGSIAGGCQPLPSRMPSILAGWGAKSRHVTSKPCPLAVGSQLPTWAGSAGWMDCR
jgi:hypothetical protein